MLRNKATLIRLYDFYRIEQIGIDNTIISVQKNFLGNDDRFEYLLNITLLSIWIRALTFSEA